MPNRAATYPSLDAFPERLRGGCVAIGNFDGVHRGHQAVIARASALGRPVVALTFEPHPRSFFKPDAPVFRLTPAPLKAELLGIAGCDAVVTLAFDAGLAGEEAEAFVERVLVAGLGAKAVVAGFDFHFGKGRGGTPAFLEEAGRRKGFSTAIVGAFTDEGGGVVSSSVVREALAAGDIGAANAALGWRYAVDGAVVHGDKRGRVLGYPTANMALPPETGLAHGVYAVRARAKGAWYTGAANFGRRIQFGGGETLLETFLVGFSGDLYGERLRIEFCGHLRPEQRFESVSALVDQMGRDVDQAREIVAAVSRAPRGAMQAGMEG